ncbi:hypothetical protein KBI52_04545 [Microvirga sp. HBU67558]|uniref:hypothetical protein n=1 Tax=Microvirga TaxID=186650 RepID=UPI001B363F8E|nr:MULTISPECIES: hypothetical protein [unclassified Microvirga]MBQ0819492.1 hypothetical protein [Microvirga sp. HBU67558]
MNIVEVEGVYVWIEYEVSAAIERSEQMQVFRNILEPLGLVYSGSGCALGTGWCDIDFDVPVGTDLHAIRDALDVDLGFAFVAKPGYLSED